MKIGFIGLGIMGSRMAANLSRAGYPLRVHNRTRSKADALLSDQVIWKDSPQEVARDVDIMCTMLSTPEVVREIALGRGGFLSAMKEGTTWMDCSTVNPSFSREMASIGARYTVDFLDAPVAGSKIPAEKGELLFLVGGDQGVLETCVPLFQAMGRKYIHAGENGKGSALKMVFNLLLGTSMLAFSEGIILGESLGLSKAFLLEVLLQSPVVAPFISSKKEKLTEEQYDVEFPLQWMQKDLHLVCQSGFEEGSPLPATNVAKEMYGLAKQYGLSEQDFSSIYGFLKRRDR